MICHAIFGIFCVAIPLGTPAAGADNSEFGAVGIAAQGWTANFGMGTNNFGPLNPEKLSKLCKDGHCIRYWRHCAPTRSKKIACDFSFDENYTSIGVSIAADTQKDANHALASIGYLQDRKKPEGAISLSDFSEESKLNQPPECLYAMDGKSDEGCPAKRPSPPK